MIVFEADRFPRMRDGIWSGMLARLAWAQRGGDPSVMGCQYRYSEGMNLPLGCACIIGLGLTDEEAAGLAKFSAGGSAVFDLIESGDLVVSSVRQMEALQAIQLLHDATTTVFRPHCDYSAGHDPAPLDRLEAYLLERHIVGEPISEEFFVNAVDWAEAEFAAA